MKTHEFYCGCVVSWEGDRAGSVVAYHQEAGCISDTTENMDWATRVGYFLKAHHVKIRNGELVDAARERVREVLR